MQDYFAPTRNALAGIKQDVRYQQNRADQQAQNALAADYRRMQMAELQQQGQMRAQEQARLDSFRRNVLAGDLSSPEGVREIYQGNPVLAAKTFGSLPGMMPAAAEPPQTRTVNRGGETVTEEWWPNGWAVVGTAPRWNPNPTPAATVTVNNGPDTPGRKKADELFADEYVQFTAAGGSADVAKNLAQLDDVVKSLESGKNLTGPVIGSLPDAVNKFANPEAVNTRELLEEVVQRNLRLVLGAQFTEKEGERLIKRAYNPTLDEKQNVRRVRRLANQIKFAAKSKQSAANFFEKNGTITGWAGKNYTMDDFLALFPEDEGAATAGGIKFLGFE